MYLLLTAHDKRYAANTFSIFLNTISLNYLFPITYISVDVQK